MHRTLSLVFIVVTSIAVGVYLFRLVQPFLLPLLMAGTLAVLVQPAYDQLVKALHGKRRVAAALMSLLMILLLVVPLLATLTLATQELLKYGTKVVKNESADTAVGTEEDPDAYIDPDAVPVVSDVERSLSQYMSQADLNDVRSGLADMSRTILSDIYEGTAGLLSNILGFTVGVVIMMLAFYYFLAEGPAIARELESVLPFEAEDEEALLKRFERICRGVVLGTLVAALVQGVLLGIALAILRVPAVWLLICLTFVTSMLPFIGSAGVYVPVSIYLMMNERYMAALCLLIYGMLIVSTADNLVRAHVVHGTSRLHPLVALISALGALKLVGLWGIFVGPIVAGIFYALLKILQQKLKRLDRAAPAERHIVLHE